MPLYEYYCVDCEEEYELKQSFKDKPLKKCPNCKSRNIRKVLFAPYVSIKNNPKTLGHLAERNTSKMGKYEKEHKYKRLQENKEKAKLESLKRTGQLPEDVTELPSKKTWYNTEGKNLVKDLKNLNTPQKIKNYIIKGEK